MFEAFRQARRPVKEIVSLGRFRTLKQARREVAFDFEVRFGSLPDTYGRFRTNRINFDYWVIEFLDDGKFIRHAPLEE